MGRVVKMNNLLYIIVHFIDLVSKMRYSVEL